VSGSLLAGAHLNCPIPEESGRKLNNLRTFGFDEKWPVDVANILAPFARDRSMLQSSTAQLTRWSIFPIVFVGSLLTFYYLLASDIPGAVALLSVSIGSLLVIAVLELALPYRREWTWVRDRQLPNDLIHGLLLSTLGPRIGEIASTTIIVAAAAALSGVTDHGIWPSAWPFWLQLLLAIVIADFTEWCKHWAFHRIPWLWPIHALHHDIDRLHVAKGARLHFLESTVRVFVVTVPLVILGASPEVLFWYAAVLNVVGNLNHSNVDTLLPKAAHYVFQTPQVHRLHHAIDAELGRSNLSSISMLPDLLFGTFRHPAKHNLDAVGIVGSPIGGNLFTQLASPFAWPLLTRRSQSTKPSSVIASTGVGK